MKGRAYVRMQVRAGVGAKLCASMAVFKMPVEKEEQMPPARPLPQRATSLA